MSRGQLLQHLQCVVPSTQTTVVPLRLCVVIATLVALVSLSLVHSEASAQQKTRLRLEQIQLYKDARLAFKQNDFVLAEAKLREALELGEANILLLNLGRALFKQGKCRQAAATYDATEEATEVYRPSPREVRAKLEEYRAEMIGQCPGRLELKCAPYDLGISIDGAAPRPCNEQPFDLMPGTYRITAKHGETEFDESVPIESLQDVPLTLAVPGESFDPPPPKPPPPKPPPEELDKPLIEDVGPWQTWGYVTMGVGGATVLTAVALEIFAIRPAIDDFNADKTDAEQLDKVESLQSTTLTVYTAGFVLVGAGAVVTWLVPWIFGPDGETPADNPAPSGGARLEILDGGASVVWEARW